jgi:hypothetical protein
LDDDDADVDMATVVVWSEPWGWGSTKKAASSRIFSSGGEKMEGRFDYPFDDSYVQNLHKT